MKDPAFRKMSEREGMPFAPDCLRCGFPKHPTAPFMEIPEVVKVEAKVGAVVPRFAPYTGCCNKSVFN